MSLQGGGQAPNYYEVPVPVNETLYTFPAELAAAARQYTSPVFARPAPFVTLSVQPPFV